MSTSVTQKTWQIVVHDQLEMHTQLRWWSVAVWTDYDRDDLAQCHWQNDNFDWNKYELSGESLETLITVAADIVERGRK